MTSEGLFQNGSIRRGETAEEASEEDEDDRKPDYVYRRKHIPEACIAIGQGVKISMLKGKNVKGWATGGASGNSSWMR